MGHGVPTRELADMSNKVVSKFAEQQSKAFQARFEHWVGEGCTVDIAKRRAEIESLLMSFGDEYSQADATGNSESVGEIYENASSQRPIFSVDFNPRQTHFKIIHPTCSSVWKCIAEKHEVNWLRFTACGIGSLIFSAALVTLGAQAGGSTSEAWFWAALVVICGSILMALPVNKQSVSSWLQKVLGLSLLVVGYITMHASILTSENKAVSTSAAGSTEVQQREIRITDLENQLKPLRDAIARLDPVKNRSTITSLREEAKDLEKDLSKARDSLIAAKDNAKAEASVGLIKKWSLVEWLRRLMLEPLNILCLHGFLAELPGVIAMVRRRSAIVQVAA